MVQFSEQHFLFFIQILAWTVAILIEILWIFWLPLVTS